MSTAAEWFLGVTRSRPPVTSPCSRPVRPSRRTRPQRTGSSIASPLPETLEMSQSESRPTPRPTAGGAQFLRPVQSRSMQGSCTSTPKLDQSRRLWQHREPALATSESCLLQPTVSISQIPARTSQPRVLTSSSGPTSTTTVRVRSIQNRASQ